MNRKYKIAVLKGSSQIREFKGRIVGIISNEEATAILNTKGSAKKVFTSESLDVNEVYNKGFNSRIVFATTDINNSKSIIITPVAKYMTKHFIGTGKFIKFKTAGQLEYKIYY